MVEVAMRWIDGSYRVIRNTFDSIDGARRRLNLAWRGVALVLAAILAVAAAGLVLVGLGET